jgi:hypothetical protein
MKKLLIALACTLMSVPAVAHDTYRNNEHVYRGGDNTGAVIAGVLGGIVFGTLINPRQQDFNYDRMRNSRIFNNGGARAEGTCQEFRVLDREGYMTSRYVCF